MVTREQIAQALQRRLANVDIDHLEHVPDTSRITGFIVSDAFNELDHPERQALLWRILAEAFGERELSNVGPIATLSSAEAELKVGESD